MKKKLSNFILIMVFLIGLSLLLYPILSDYWNSFHQTVAIGTYTEAISQVEDDVYEEIWQSARGYNKRLLEDKDRWKMTEDERKDYYSQMNIPGTTLIGYVDIPKIDCELAIYHGVEEKVLQVAIGHVEGSSLPIGGLGTHTVLSGHRGLPSAKLFTDLDELIEGDVFMLQIMDQTLTYEVDQILTVLPRDLDALAIEEDKDYCTLVTCTPYGINTHRLLVRGHRIENVEGLDSLRVAADAMQIDPVIVAPIVAVPILLILLGFILAKYSKKK